MALQIELKCIGLVTACTLSLVGCGGSGDTENRVTSTGTMTLAHKLGACSDSVPMGTVIAVDALVDLECEYNHYENRTQLPTGEPIERSRLEIPSLDVSTTLQRGTCRYENQYERVDEDCSSYCDYDDSVRTSFHLSNESSSHLLTGIFEGYRETTGGDVVSMFSADDTPYETYVVQATWLWQQPEDNDCVWVLEFAIDGGS